VSALLNSLAAMDPDDASEDLLDAGTAIMRAFQLTASDDEERHVRVLSATAALTFACLTAVRVNQAKEWRSMIVAPALDTLGHRH
jgi:hypothetical protein